MKSADTAAEKIQSLIRDLEDARHKGLEHVCAVMTAALREGWQFALDPNVPAGRVHVTTARHYNRSVKHGFAVGLQNIVRCGALFEPALDIALTEVTKQKETP